MPLGEIIAISADSCFYINYKHNTLLFMYVYLVREIVSHVIQLLNQLEYVLIERGRR